MWKKNWIDSEVSVNIPGIACRSASKYSHRLNWCSAAVAEALASLSSVQLMWCEQGFRRSEIPINSLARFLPDCDCLQNALVGLSLSPGTACFIGILCVPLNGGISLYEFYTVFFCDAKLSYFLLSRWLLFLRTAQRGGSCAGRRTVTDLLNHNMQTEWEESRSPASDWLFHFL